jgi:TBC1 domain family member 6
MSARSGPGERLSEEHPLSVEEAIREAMNTPQARPHKSRHAPPVQDATSRSLPEPHLPLRKASPQKLRSKYAPKPLFAPSQRGVPRGFHPRPVEPLPRIAAVTASTEHAFAARDSRRPSKLPLGSIALRHGHEERERQYAEARPSSSMTTSTHGDNMPPSSPLLPPPASPRDRQGLRGSKSLGEGIRGLRSKFSPGKKTEPLGGRATPESIAPRPSMGTDEVRQSFRSALTSHSSYLNTSSINTDHSSLTGNSSHSEFVNVYPNWPEVDEGADSQAGSVTNDDLIGMYADGFESAKQSMDTMYAKRSFQVERTKLSLEAGSRASLQVDRPMSAQGPQSSKRPNAHHRRSQSASLLLSGKPAGDGGLKPPEVRRVRTSNEIMNNNMRVSEDTRPKSNSSATAAQAVPRDRYGFKKASHYITVEQYDAWDAKYSEHLARRSKKWHALMRSFGLSTDHPYRFPAPSDKIKRYVRKGIPPEFRGAAWFWYAHGPAKQKQNPGLYQRLLEKVQQGELSDSDREHIERDLNRTFPDNIRFKPDPTDMSDVQAGAGGGKKRRSIVEPETSVVQALRRVLQAFAVHNPGIGYCQSLNFIAGLLLLFLDEDEEKAFILLNIITTEHLPGTHGVALEGANIDIAVLMACIKDSMPPIWDRLDDKGGGLIADATAQSLRLPTVSLATTAWFMSLFVGTLPIESVLRVWDCLFFEGSKTLFRVALAIFKAGESQILAVNDPMEIFQVVQTIPRRMLDINSLMECAFGRTGHPPGRRRGGFTNVNQKDIDRMREERRRDVKAGVAGVHEGGAMSRWRGKWRRGTRN